MRRARGRFERYRKAHTGRRPIPEALWKMAAELAKEHGHSERPKCCVWTTANSRLSTAALGSKRKATPPQCSWSCCRHCHPTRPRVPHRAGRPSRQNAYSVEGRDRRGLGRAQPGSVGVGDLQVAPQMRVLVAIEPVDLRKGIDGLAQLCREKLGADPFSGYLFIFAADVPLRSNYSHSTGRDFGWRRSACRRDDSAGGRRVRKQPGPCRPVGAGRASGVAPAGPHDGAAERRLGAGVRAPDLPSGNLRGHGALPWHLLPGGELGAGRTHHRPRRRRSHASREPLDQGSAGTPLHRRFRQLLSEVER